VWSLGGSPRLPPLGRSPISLAFKLVRRAAGLGTQAACAPRPIRDNRFLFSLSGLRLSLLLLLILAVVPSLQAGPTEEWQTIVALDAGPKKKPTNREEVTLLARAHLARQRQALTAFMARYPQDPHRFEAQLRLAALVAAEGKMNNSPSQVDKALTMLANLEKSPGVPRETQADAAFQHVALYMQSQIGSTNRMRESIIDAARSFTAKYPGDRRGPRLLVEVATLCDDVPNKKRDLLDEALRLTKEDALKHRIADDYKRLERLGRPLEFKVTSLQGPPIDLAALRGHVVVLVFWSAESPHCLLWLRNFRSQWEKLPKGNLRVITISLDTDRKSLDQRLSNLPRSWPAYFDGKGWESPLARSLGINALPSVWILDKKGILRTFNAREGTTNWIQNLLRE